MTKYLRLQYLVQIDHELQVQFPPLLQSIDVLRICRLDVKNSEVARTSRRAETRWECGIK